MRPFRIPASLGTGVIITRDTRPSHIVILWHARRQWKKASARCRGILRGLARYAYRPMV